MYNFIFYYTSFISFLSLKYLDINKKCCYKCNFNHKKIEPIKKVISLQTNTKVNITSNATNESKNKKNLSNYYILSNSKEINISSEGNKKFDMDIIFKINDDKNIKINSNDKLSEKYRIGDIILINDKNNFIRLNKGITYLKYEEI